MSDQPKTVKFIPNQNFRKRFDKPYVFAAGQEYELPVQYYERIKHLVTVVKQSKEK